MKKVWIKIAALMIILPLFALAQDSDSPKATKGQKKAEAKKEQRLMNEKKAEIEGRKMHKAIQTKEVRKRMKKSAKEANRWNTGNRKFFLVRWFEKKK
jgi:Ni/Co efflux regulator RcnB